MAFQIILTEKPTIAELQEHVRTNKWHELGLQLQLDSTSLDAIRRDNSNVEDHRREMFSLFLSTDTQASRKQILEAMRKNSVEEMCMADDYEKYLHQLSDEELSELTDDSSLEGQTLPLQDHPSYKAFNTMSRETNRINKLSAMAKELQKKFRCLTIIVRRSLKDEDLEDLKLLLCTLLAGISDDTIPGLGPVQNEIEKINSIQSLFRYLIRRKYMSYFNYELLCEFANAVITDQTVHAEIKKYEKFYHRFIEEPTFADLIEVFSKNPDLNPNTFVGLPTIVVTLACESRELKYKHWQIEGWGKYVKSKLVLLDAMFTNSIILIYAIFPTDLWQVVNDLQNPKAQEYFQEIGATIEIPEATQEVIKLFSELESSSDLAGEPQLKFHPFEDQVKNLEEQIQCLKVDNEQLRLHVNDFITNSIGHIGHDTEAIPVKTHGDMEHLISEELKIEKVIGLQTHFTSGDSEMISQIPLGEDTLHQVSEGALPPKLISEGTLQVSENESLLVFSSETGNTVTCQLVDKLIQRVSDFEHSLHLQQEQLDSNVKEIQDIKNDLKSLSQTVLTGPEIAEERLQSLVKLIEQKFDQYQSYILETQMSKSYFEEHYAGVISSNHTEISEIKDAIKLLQEKRLDDASNTRIPPDGISNTFESVRSKLDQLVDSLVPKEVSVNRQIQLREVRREQKSSIYKKRHPKSELLQTPETIFRLQRSSSTSSTSSASSGYKSIIHQDSDEQSTQPDFTLIGEASTILVDFTPGATNSPTPHRPTSTLGPENSEEAPDKMHIIVEVAWAMGDLLDLLITLSTQNKATLEDEK